MINLILQDYTNIVIPIHLIRFLPWQPVFQVCINETCGHTSCNANHITNLKAFSSVWVSVLDARTVAHASTRVWMHESRSLAPMKTFWPTQVTHPPARPNPKSRLFLALRSASAISSRSASLFKEARDARVSFKKYNDPMCSNLVFIIGTTTPLSRFNVHKTRQLTYSWGLRNEGGSVESTSGDKCGTWVTVTLQLAATFMCRGI